MKYRKFTLIGIRQIFTISLSFLVFVLPAQKSPCIIQTTIKANSPSVWAQDFSISYGIRPSILDQLVLLYEKDGTNTQSRRPLVEKLIKDLTLLPPSEKTNHQLSRSAQKQLGILEDDCIKEALEWHLYTQGANSPAVYAIGNVSIWYGIPQKAFRSIVSLLEEQKDQIEDFGKQIAQQIKHFEELQNQLEARPPYDAVAKKAKILLNNGEIKEAEKLLESDFNASGKHLAYKGYELGKIKELALKYEEAREYFRTAITLDSLNSGYLLAYADNLLELAVYDEAILIYQKALSTDSIVTNDNHERVSDLYNGLGSTWQSIGEYDHAITSFEKSLNLDTIEYNNKSRGPGRAYNNLSLVYWEKSEYNHALALVEKALSVDTLVYGLISSNIATVFNNIGLLWSEKGEYDVALTYLGKALNIDTILYGTKHPDVGRDFNNIGMTWGYKGDFDKGIIFFQKALSINLIVYHEIHPRVSATYGNIGANLQEKGDYNLAFDYFEKALNIDTIIYGKLHPMVALNYYYLGSNCLDKGEYNRSKDFYEQSLEIYTKVFGETHFMIAYINTSLGLICGYKGDYGQAVVFHEKALKAAEKMYGNLDPLVAGIYLNLGSSWQDQDEYGKAIEFYEKALNIDTLKYGMLHYKTAKTYVKLGSVLADQNKYDKAIEFYEKALNIDTLKYGITNLEVANIYNSLGWVRFDTGNYNGAIEFFKKALSINKILLSGGQNRTTALFYNNLGIAWKSKGELMRSISFFRDAKSILSPLASFDDPEFKKILTNLSNTANKYGLECFLQFDYSNALSFYQEALDNAHELKDTMLIILNIENIASTLLKQEQFDEALIIINEGLLFAQDLKNKEIERPNLQSVLAESKGTLSFQTSFINLRQNKVFCLKKLGHKKDARKLRKMIKKEKGNINKAQKDK